MPSTRTHCFFCFCLLLWLAAWIVLSWGAVQDDSFIHFRYATNLASRSFVTYDGVHPNFGSSSLLYIGLLALLRGVAASPELPRVVSSAVHLLLFCGLGIALGMYLPRQARAARLAGAVLLALLVTPSAVRWLDDGMETGLVVSIAMVMAWMLHAACGLEVSRLRCTLLGVAAFAAVMLRTELLLLCGVGFLILVSKHFFESLRKDQRHRSFDDGAHGNAVIAIDQAPTFRALADRSREEETSVWPSIAIAVGAAIAAAVIVSTMHVLLPDTAVAKAHGIGHWFSPLHDTAVTLAGAFSFGAGMLMLWLLTLGLAAMRTGLTLRTVLANCLCPVVLAMSSLRGQEIQGVRYFSWTFAFSIVWNILELAREAKGTRTARMSEWRGVVLLYVFAALLAVELPVESMAIRHVLTGRSETMRMFASQHLEVLRDRRGVAADVGFIGYFSEAQICDLAGLVNGRASARLTSKERLNACAQAKPEFMFLNNSQFGSMATVMGTNDWKVCGQYDFPNIRNSDMHYLLVEPEIAEEVCRATGRQPETVAAVFTAAPALVAERAGE